MHVTANTAEGFSSSHDSAIIVPSKRRERSVGGEPKRSFSHLAASALRNCEICDGNAVVVRGGVPRRGEANVLNSEVDDYGIAQRKEAAMEPYFQPDAGAI